MTHQQHWRRLAIAGHEGDEPTARAALTDTDPVARQLALGSLRRMEALTEADLLAAFADESPAVRHRAALLAAEWPEVSVLPLLRDSDSTVVEAAAWAAGEQEEVDDTVLELLCILGTSADDPMVRESAVAALGAIGDERGLATILAGCIDKPAVRRRAVLALAPFEGPAVDAALAAALVDRDWQVRQAAEDLLPHMSPTLGDEPADS